MVDQVNIVVLDGYTLTPGDLDWSSLSRLGHSAIYDRTAPRDVLPRAKDADVVFTNKTIHDREVICALPRLKYIGVLATGYNVVDVAYAVSNLEVSLAGKKQNVITPHAESA